MYVCPVKCTETCRIDSSLIQLARCVTECRVAVSLHCAKWTHMMQPAQHIQCRMPNTITTEHVLNTQCTICFRSTCQSLHTSSYCQCCLQWQTLTLSTPIQTVRTSHSICRRPSTLHTTHLSARPFQQFVSCSVLLSLLLINVIFMSLLLQL